MASAEAWALLQEFRREWLGRRREPTEDDLADLIDKAIDAGRYTDWEGEEDAGD